MQTERLHFFLPWWQHKSLNLLKWVKNVEKWQMLNSPHFLCDGTIKKVDHCGFLEIEQIIWQNKEVCTEIQYH